MGVTITRRKFIWYILLVLGFMCGPGWIQLVHAQEPADLKITDVKTGAFPQIHVHVQTRDAQGQPLSERSTLQVSENNTAISNFDVTTTPKGIDVTFVLDANPTFDQIDDNSGLTRKAKVEASVQRFAADFMQLDGSDSVSVVVPAIGNVQGAYLVEAETDANVVRQALDRYETGELNETPLQEMLVLALEGARNRENGRFQAILLFTDGASLHNQLDFPALVAHARDANVSIYTAILGARADANEIANIEQLSPLTQASYLHMPTFEATDPIYQIWQAQQTQWVVSYQSTLRSSGQGIVSLNWASESADAQTTAVYDIELLAPKLALGVPEPVIRRVGEAPDTPLDQLLPAQQTINLTVNWPDGLPRTLAEAHLFMNGQPAKATLTAGALDWNIGALEAGQYRLVAEIVDEFGFRATSEPLLLEIRTEWPLPPPTPTVVPEASPLAWLPSYNLSLEQILLVLGGIAFTGLFLFFLRWWGQRPPKKSKVVEEKLEIEDLTAVDKTEALLDTEATDIHIPALECLDESINFGILVLIASSVTLGRDENHAQLLIADRSISRLHARIKKDRGGYWLYDEGSASGTKLNFERIGLIPQRLEDGAMLQLGRVPFRFHLRQPSEIKDWTWPDAPATSVSEA